MTELTTTVLQDLGFIDIGVWFSNGLEISYKLEGSDVSANEVRLNSPKALYAFIQKDKVQYIGKTARTLRKRFVGYKRPGRTQSTNIRCNGKIKEAIAGGEEVRICVFTPIPHLRYQEFNIDLAAGLEDSLIAEFKPPWNGRERGRVLTEEAEREEAEEEAILQLDPTLKELQETTIDLRAPVLTTFAIILGEAYYNQGLINPGVAASRYLGQDKEPIQVLFDDGTEPIISGINRTANISGGVRVVGRNRSIALWFQRHFQKGDTVQARVLSANQILLLSGQIGLA